MAMSLVSEERYKAIGLSTFMSMCSSTGPTTLCHRTFKYWLSGLDWEGVIIFMAPSMSDSSTGPPRFDPNKSFPMERDVMSWAFKSRVSSVGLTEKGAMMSA
jgi:hypothetical protein